jgi:hypothetical protein
MRAFVLWGLWAFAQNALASRVEHEVTVKMQKNEYYATNRGEEAI